MITCLNDRTSYYPLQRLSEMHIIVCLLVKPRAAAIYDLCKCSGRAKEQQSTLVAHSMSQVGHNKDIHVYYG